MVEKTDDLTPRGEGQEYSWSYTPPAATEVASIPVDNGNMDDPEVIRAEIAQTRAQMSETIETIQARLTPDSLKQQAQEVLRDATVGKVKEMTHTAEHTVKNWRLNVASTIKENPVPAALIAVGVGWLLMADGKSTSRDPYPGYRSYQDRGYPEAGGRPYTGYAGGYGPQGHYQQYQSGSPTRRVSEVAENLQQTAGEVGSNIQETAQQVAGQAREQVEQAKEQVGHFAQEAQYRVERVADQAEYQYMEAKRGFQQMMTENPLAVGAVALVAGAAVGLLVPTTPQEGEWMGEARDRFVEKAQTAAQETMERVGHKVEEKVEEVGQNLAESKRPATTTSMSERQTEPTRPRTENDWTTTTEAEDVGL